MARRIPFSLKMADGAAVRTIEELREHFDLASVLGYYEDGRLSEWLADRYYDDEADKVRALDKSSGDFKKSLCVILGVPYSGSKADQLHFSSIVRNNEHRERLKQFTADDAILAVADRVALTQHELEGLLDKGVKEIYLWGNDGEQFIIPGRREGITYIGLNHPMVKFDGEIVEPNIDFQDLEVNINDYIDGSGDNIEFYHFFDNNRVLGVKLLHIAAEKESAEAQYELGNCYKRGFGVVKNHDKAVKWYQKAAEQGYAEAQYRLGRYYMDYWLEWEDCNDSSMDDNYDERVKACKKAEKWYQKAAEQGFAEAQYELGKCYKDHFYVLEISGYERDKEIAKWYRKAAEQGHAAAQYELSGCYINGEDVVENYDEAVKWCRKAAEQGYAEAQYQLGYYCIDSYEKHHEPKALEEAIAWYKRAAEQGFAEAQYELGKCYEYGRGVDKSDGEAIEWYKRAAEQGYAEAQYELGQCYEYGRGVDKSDEEAIKWYRKAAKRNHPTAEYRLKLLTDDKFRQKMEKEIKRFLR